jgi:hypothetical protein
MRPAFSPAAVRKRRRRRAFLKIDVSKQTVFYLCSPKAVESSGVAGEFRCFSLHRSQISKDL